MMKKIKEQTLLNIDGPEWKFICKYAAQQLFSKQEDALSEYIIRSSKLQCGWTYSQIADTE